MSLAPDLAFALASRGKGGHLVSHQGLPCLTPARRSCDGPVIHRYKDTVAENVTSNVLYLGLVVDYLALILE